MSFLQKKSGATFQAIHRSADPPLVRAQKNMDMIRHDNPGQDRVPVFQGEQMYLLDDQVSIAPGKQWSAVSSDEDHMVRGARFLPSL